MRRRAFLVAGVAFVGGAFIGFWCKGQETIEAKEPADPIVAWVREVASAPERTAELREHHHGLLYAIEKVPLDPIIWQGFRQIVDQLSSTSLELPDVMVARALRQSLEAHRPPLPDYDQLLERLRVLGEAKKR